MKFTYTYLQHFREDGSTDTVVCAATRKL